MEKFKTTNIVRIGSNEKIDNYISSIIYRMAPHIYSLPEHRCIILQVRESLLEFAEAIVKRVKWAGLIEVSKKKKELPNEKMGYSLQGYEIILEKIPPLILMEEDMED